MKTKIETKQVTERTSPCPILLFKYEFPEYERCERCSFFSDGFCCTKEYKVEKFKTYSETEDDEYGGMPVTDYRWMFPCSKCQKEITYYSGMSSINTYISVTIYLYWIFQVLCLNERRKVNVK